MSVRSLICRNCGHHFDAHDEQAEHCFICERLAELTSPSPVSSRLPRQIRRIDQASPEHI